MLFDTLLKCPINHQRCNKTTRRRPNKFTKLLEIPEKRLKLPESPAETFQGTMKHLALKHHNLNRAFILPQTP